MNTPSEDIKDMLEGESSFGLAFPTNLGIGREPARPLDYVTIFDIPGGERELTIQNDVQYHRPSIQIRVRNIDYLTGYALILAIVDFLHGKNNETWNGTRYLSIACVIEPAPLDWQQNAARFVTTLNIQRREA